MCGIFGFSDPNHSMSAQQAVRLTNALARASEVRGKDATGIAYVSAGKLRVYKRSLPADKMKLYFPADMTQLVGHVRMTTQGTARRNWNNHPFVGRFLFGEFALAHNGVLYNEKELRAKYGLKTESIETDSYVAVQLLEAAGGVSLDTIKAVAEQLDGSFAFNILDTENNLYLVRGNNPLSIWREDSTGLTVYASTEEILKGALQSLPALRNRIFARVPIGEGEIIRIGAAGDAARKTFSMEVANRRYFRGCESSAWLWADEWNSFGKACGYAGGHKRNAKRASPLDELLETACNMGYDPEDIALLMEAGFDEADIEELMQSNEGFAYAVSEAKYESMYW